MRGLEQIPLNQLLTLWGELVEAMHGVNHYGGDTAELYAYRFGIDLPATQLGGEIGDEAVADRDHQRAESLYALLKLFEESYEVRVEVLTYRDCGRRIGPWLARDRFVHRAHVRVRERRK